jgi:predicted nuclease of restriction endonuclease-like (RecB) superfamily
MAASDSTLKKPVVKREAIEPLTAPAGYDDLLRDIKVRVRTAQIRAGLAVNKELVLLYWGIGRDILQRQQEQGWGSKVIERLAIDLRRELPDMSGLSRTNLLYMRAFAEAWADEAIVQQVVGQIPRGHNVRLLDHLKTSEERLWYARAAIEHGWSRNVLVLHIESKLFERQGKATTNFERALPPPQSDLARELLKDPYNFEFLTLQKDAEEREIESGLVAHIQKFLLELGAGFAFVGRQYHIEIDGEDFYIDLLFYHLKLRRYVVVELKSGKFKPEYAGKINFYLAVVDDLLRHPDDAPSIGLILCKQKGRIMAEYALRNLASPIGISEFRITEALPDMLKSGLPTVEQLEAELTDIDPDEPDSGET